MYDTLARLKPGESFTVEDLHRLVVEVTRATSAAVERTNQLVSVTLKGGRLDIGWSNAAHVLEESNEIAEQFGAASRGCKGRFEMAGNDPAMELFNSYLLINERLQKTGKFVIFDTQECTFPFDDPP